MTLVTIIWSDSSSFTADLSQDAIDWYEENGITIQYEDDIITEPTPTEQAPSTQDPLPSDPALIPDSQLGRISKIFSSFRNNTIKVDVTYQMLFPDEFFKRNFGTSTKDWIQIRDVNDVSITNKFSTIVLSNTVDTGFETFIIPNIQNKTVKVELFWFSQSNVALAPSISFELTNEIDTTRPTPGAPTKIDSTFGKIIAGVFIGGVAIAALGSRRKK